MARTAEQINDQINQLVMEYWQLVKPTDKELRDAKERLTEDPLNDLSEIVNADDSVSSLLILEEIICVREMEQVDEADAG